MSKRLKKEVMILVVSLLVFLYLLPVALSLDSDRDGIPDENDKYPKDFDNDGMPDEWEVKYGLSFDVANGGEDEDKDGMTNLEEYNKGTNPNPFYFDDSKETKPSDDGLDDKMAWPLTFFPVLIIIFIFFLYFYEKYELNLLLKEAYQKYFLMPKQKKKTIGSDQKIIQKGVKIPKTSLTRKIQLKKFQEDSGKDAIRNKKTDIRKYKPKSDSFKALRDFKGSFRKQKKDKATSKSLENLRAFSKSKKSVFERLKNIK